jgi:hypothetical protein
MRVAEAIHASDEYVGVLLAGSTWPLLTGGWFLRRAVRRRRAAALTLDLEDAIDDDRDPDAETAVLPKLRTPNPPSRPSRSQSRNETGTSKATGTRAGTEPRSSTSTRDTAGAGSRSGTRTQTQTRTRTRR